MNNRPPLNSQQANELLRKIINLDQVFYFDWNNYETFEYNARQIEDVEKFLDEADQFKSLSSEVKEQLGPLLYDLGLQRLAKLNYKLGTYYNHIVHDPDKALAYLNAAKPFVESDDKAWVCNHIAYSYQQKMALTEDKKTRQSFYNQARDNYNYIIDNYVYATPNEPEQMKIFAFTMCVKGLTEYDANDTKSAQLSYRHAIECYEAIKSFDDQYARTMRHYGIILAQSGLELAAKDIFEKLHGYWREKRTHDNPYAGQLYETHADFLVENYPQKLTDAVILYKLAFFIAEATGNTEKKEVLQDKRDKLLEQLRAESGKQLPNVGLYKPKSSQLTLKEPALDKTYRP